MPRQIIYFTEETFEMLKTYIQIKHGRHRAMSITVQQAVKEFLERDNGSNNNLPSIHQPSQEYNLGVRKLKEKKDD